MLRCPSSLTFHIFDFSSEAEFSEYWQEARSQRPLQNLCLSGQSKKKKQDGRPGILLTATFSTSPLKPLNGIQRNLKGSKISTSSTKFVVSGPIEKTRWQPWCLIDWDILNFSSVTAIWNSTKLGRKQDLKVLYQGCVFPADWKNKMATPASDWLRHSRLLLWNRWMEFNKIHRKQDLNVFYHVCVFRVYRRNKIAARPVIGCGIFDSPLKPLNGIQQNLTGRKISTPSNKFVFFGSIGGKRWPPSLWFAETFRLLLRDRWTRFNETWQEARSQRPLPICVIRADKKGRSGLWLAETFSTSPPWPLNRIQRNLTGSKISTSSTKFVLFDRRNLTGSKISMSYTKFGFFGPMRKTRWLPGLWLTETFSTSPLNGIQQNLKEIRYVNAIFQVCVFRADRKNILLMFTICGPCASCLYILSRNENI